MSLDSVAEQAAALANHTVTSAALTQAALERAAAAQPTINAFITIEAETARAEAAASDARRAAGQARGPLDGVPMAHKDMFDRAGQIATGGSPILAERRALTDSAVSERLAAAGTVWLGGLNLSEFAASPTGINVHYGATRNPHDTDYITGGSSSGSGAAVAAGIVAAALGSDTGGSIRLPASMCGVTGLKPTYGRVSRFGVMPRAPSLDTVGPLARTALDCALLLATIAGPDARDPTALDMPVPDAAGLLAGGEAGLAARIAPGTTLAVLAGPAIENLPSEIRACCNDAVRGFRAAGLQIVERRLEWLAELYPLADTISKCEAATLHERWMRERPGDYSAFLFSRTLAGFHLPATRYIGALSRRASLLDRFVTEGLDGAVALLLPTVPVPVPRIDAADVTEGDAVATLIAGLSRLTRPFSYLGVPALSVPCGTDAAGLPVGLQLVGRPFADFDLLGLGARLQQRTDWHRVRPASPTGSIHA